MAYFGPAVLSLAIAALIAWLELVTSKYPRTFFLLKNCWALYAYALIYGVISFGFMLGLDWFIKAGTIKLEGPGLSSPWVQSIVVGLSTKALLHIRLFSVSVGSQTFPFGTESLVQLFEPWLLDKIELAEFNAVRNFIDPRASKYTDLDDVKAKIKANLPRTFQGPERTAFQVDVEKATTVVEAMELYLGRFGRASFDRVFPP